MPDAQLCPAALGWHQSRDSTEEGKDGADGLSWGEGRAWGAATLQ